MVTSLPFRHISHPMMACFAGMDTEEPFLPDM
jgi:hypothetical protein